MVHALKQIWRVLIPGGVLVDLRPRVSDRPLEVVSNGRVMPAGTVDNSPFISDEMAADNAITQMADEKWLLLENQTFFDCNLYWDRLDELIAYYAELPSPPLIIPDAVATQARTLENSADPDSTVRLRLTLGLSTYRKSGVGSVDGQ